MSDGSRFQTRNEWYDYIEKYNSSKLITDLENSILVDIEKSIKDGQLTSQERKDYLEIVKVIVQRYIKHLDKLKYHEKKLHDLGYNDRNAKIEHEYKNVPAKIVEMSKYIEDCKNNLSTEQNQIIKQIYEIDVKNNDDLLKRYSE